MRLLSVDWDYFFPLDPAWDWGYRESPLFIQPEYLWVSRAADFLLRGKPLPNTSGQEEGFWRRFHIGGGAQLYWAENHCQIFCPAVMQGVTEIWNYDAHHDAGYDESAFLQAAKTGQVTCDMWAAFAAVHTRVLTRYPAWRKTCEWLDSEPIGAGIAVERETDDGEPVVERFGRVFVCRSGAWVPPWLDGRFARFMAACPTQNIVSVSGRDLDMVRCSREKIEQWARAEAERMKELRAGWERLKD